MNLRIIVVLLILFCSHLATAQQGVQYDHDAQEFQQKLEFQLYPNPLTGGTLNIVSREQGVMEIIILNILGEVVFQTSTYENYIIPQNLRSGIYIVKIKQAGRQGLSRLVVP
ncbi:MAG: T9SS type A sorting domain-containing protein [Flavobacteriaceae bacterium]